MFNIIDTTDKRGDIVVCAPLEVVWQALIFRKALSVGTSVNKTLLIQYMFRDK